jgi:hypothetical protein
VKLFGSCYIAQQCIAGLTLSPVDFEKEQKEDGIRELHQNRATFIEEIKCLKKAGES